jgi:methyltransferase (TIGR00027 family)
VILGAGLDTFAWRHRENIPPLRVFEVDHPEAQDWKRQRIKTLGLPTIHGHRFVAVDLTTETLHDDLVAAGLDWSQPILFQCVGVMMYLSREVVEAILRSIATCRAGSEIVLSYNPDPSLLDDDGREFLAIVSRRVEAMGEPLKSSFGDIQSFVRECGLEVSDHMTAGDIHQRYGFVPLTVERLIAARVSGAA